MFFIVATPVVVADAVDEQVAALLSRMTIEEKVGQMIQINAPGGVTDDFRDQIQAGRVGSILNEVDVDTVNEIQRIAVSFELHTNDLAFYDRKMQLVSEPGEFHVWVGGDSNAELGARFAIVD